MAVSSDSIGGIFTFSALAYRSLQNQPSGVESKPATQGCFIHVRFLDASKVFSVFSCDGAVVAQFRRGVRRPLNFHGLFSKLDGTGNSSIVRPF